ncbi:MAG: signal peptidase II [Bacilli bacterium]|nr:signal peptidase II [Bacilli bacterium]
MKKKIIQGLKWFFRSYIWLGVVLLGLDIFTKQLMMHLPNDNGLIANWGFVHISFTLNEGAAFGIGTGNPVANRIIYLVVATLISAGLTTYLVLKRKDMKLYIRACLIMVITGAVGNMIDRIFYGPLQGEVGLFTGKVVDWIDFYWFWGYIFNIADCCIVIAAFMLIIYVIVGEVKDAIARRNAEVSNEKVLSKSEKERLEREQNNKEESK